MLTKIEDSEFLTSDYKNFLKIYKNLTINEKCVQQFTDDNAIPYLVLRWKLYVFLEPFFLMGNRFLFRLN